MYQVSVEGGGPQKIGLSILNLNRLSIHPEGRRVAFGSGKNSAEMWVMENIIPKEK